jgi:ankyrin repeat protein
MWRYLSRIFSKLILGDAQGPDKGIYVTNVSKADLKQAAKLDDVSTLLAYADANGADAVRGNDDPQELTILHYAAAAGSVKVVRFLTSDAVGADVNAIRRNNFSPLHGAAMNGATEVCNLLLEAGAHPDVQTEPQSYAPLHSAAFGGHIDAVEALLRGGARPDVCNYRGETPAQTARRQGHTRVAERLETIMRVS